MTNQPSPNVQDYRKEDFYWNDEDGIIPQFQSKPIDLDPDMAGKITITAAPIKMDGVDMKTTRFVRTDGKTGHEIKLRMQDMDIEVELTAEEIRLWANYLYEYLWDKVLRASWINKPDGWLD